MEPTLPFDGGEGLESSRHVRSSFSFTDRWGLATGRLGWMRAQAGGARPVLVGVIERPEMYVAGQELNT